MQDRPSFQELLDAVREFLQEEIIPENVHDRARFRTLVAINALEILHREWDCQGQHITDEFEGLCQLFHPPGITPGGSRSSRELVVELNGRLAALIRRGEAPAGTFEHLLRVTAQKLEVVNPQYLAVYDAESDTDDGGSPPDASPARG
jgi:hypothetical protein